MYKKHTFRTGMMLRSGMLNDLDNQIAQNAFDIHPFTANGIDERLRSLSIKCDGSFIYLLLNNCFIAEVAI